jgi:hypothetical protein
VIRVCKTLEDKQIRDGIAQQLHEKYLKSHEGGDSGDGDCGEGGFE